jgi:hypothetical protein
MLAALIFLQRIGAAIKPQSHLPSRDSGAEQRQALLPANFTLSPLISFSIAFCYS